MSVAEGALGPVVAITQARIGSSRLPRKVLLEVAGEPLLWWHLTRLARAATLDAIVVATTDEPGSAAIVAVAERVGVRWVRGPVEDVLERYRIAAASVGAATVVRVTSDCPLIDPDLVDLAVRAYHETAASCRYLNLDAPRYPRGLDCEVFARAALDEACAQATEPHEREHVTPYIRRHAARFGTRQLAPAEPVEPHRWCVDTPDDLALIRRVLETLGGQKFGWRDVLSLLAAHPDWRDLNAHVMQKP